MLTQVVLSSGRAIRRPVEVDLVVAECLAHSIEIFDTLALEGVTIADRADLHMIETRAGPLQILALPWITRHNLLTKEELRLASFLEIETLLACSSGCLLGREMPRHTNNHGRRARHRGMKGLHATQRTNHRRHCAVCGRKLSASTFVRVADAKVHG